MAATAAAVATKEGILDLDASPVPGQIGWAVLNQSGEILRKSSEFVEEDAPVLFQMLQESTSVIDPSEGFQRLTVAFPGTCRFLVTLDEAHVYLVQTRVE